MDEQTNETQEETTTTNEERTYTQEEVDKMLQQEADRRVSEAMKKAERKKEAAVKEAQKLAKMNEEEQFKYQLEQREKAIQEKEKALMVAENKATASQVLAERGISAKLVDLVVSDDAEAMLASIRLLESEFKNSVKAEVAKRLATTTPKKNLPTDGTITKEVFRKMSLREQTDLYNNNPTLYKQLIN